MRARKATVLSLLLLVLTPSASAATISTPFNSNNGFAGNMFDVTNLTGSTIDILGTFRVNLATGGTNANVSVYYRSGSYVGFEGSPVGWTSLGTATGVDSNGNNIPTPIDVGNTFAIGPFQTYGLYVTVSNYPAAEMRYTNGSDIINDGVLSLTLGIGKGDPDFLGSTFTPRIWNGEIDYQLNQVSAIPEPSTWLLLATGLAAIILTRRRVQAR